MKNLTKILSVFLAVAMTLSVLLPSRRKQRQPQPKHWLSTTGRTILILVFWTALNSITKPKPATS